MPGRNAAAGLTFYRHSGIYYDFLTSDSKNNTKQHRRERCFTFEKVFIKCLDAGQSGKRMNKNAIAGTSPGMLRYWIERPMPMPECQCRNVNAGGTDADDQLWPRLSNGKRGELMNGMV